MTIQANLDRDGKTFVRSHHQTKSTVERFSRRFSSPHLRQLHALHHPLHQFQIELPDALPQTAEILLGHVLPAAPQNLWGLAPKYLLTR
jgi:hypothetical protein